MTIRMNGIFFLLLLLLSSHAGAVLLPRVDEMKRLVAEPPVEIEVIEPLLIEGKRQPHVVYLGYPVERVLRAVLGDQWKTAAAEIEFRALDGYVSHIPTERFDQYRAYLVFAKKHSRGFNLKSRAPDAKSISLGPYYLVWDNIHQPDLIQEGATYWPYQVNEIVISKAPEKNPVSEALSQPARELEKYCLSCHRVNGYGGNKSLVDLAEQTKMLGEKGFHAWVLDPSSIKPDSGMPAMFEGMPEPDRKALVARLFHYLNDLPRKQVDEHP
ncbi:hypothetical protein GALL_44900 [mine drainage metagenome]|uniref:Cytochrome c domain-containing protein n=1 Tax=mine drainage metagenome TaxID=410659 RepID=A0A1J5TLU9_9ZZZZ